MIKAVIFDYFGVVCSDEYWRYVKEDKNLDGSFAELANEVNLGRLKWRDFMGELSKKTGTPLSEIEELYQTEQIDPLMAEYINDLHKTYKTALLTNAHYEFIEPVIKEAHLDHIFDEIIISSRLGVTKPQAQIFEYALERLGVKPQEAIFVDDIQRHVDGAKAVGINALLYRDLKKLKNDINDQVTVLENSHS